MSNKSKKRPRPRPPASPPAKVDVDFPDEWQAKLGENVGNALGQLLKGTFGQSMRLGRLAAFAADRCYRVTELSRDNRALRREVGLLKLDNDELREEIEELSAQSKAG